MTFDSLAPLYFDTAKRLALVCFVTMKQIQKNRKSYQSDDSNINIILGYIIENSQSVANVSNSSSKDKSAAGMVHREEPFRNQEWLKNYNQQENKWLEVKEKLDGSVHISKR